MIKHAGGRSSDPGPSIRAVTFGKSQGGVGTKRLLTDRQRQKLATIGTRMKVPARSILYREETDADSIFIVTEGVVKTFRELPSGKRRLAAFLFAADVFGLSENGRYVNTAQAVTGVTLYRIPIDSLTALFNRDPELGLQFLSKATHELREAQRRAIVLTRRDAIGRLAMFLRMLEKDGTRVSDHGAISIPMSRSDIADYLGMSLEAVSRASTGLARRGLVAFDGRHIVRVVDRKHFDELVAAL